FSYCLFLFSIYPLSNHLPGGLFDFNRGSEGADVKVECDSGRDGDMTAAPSEAGQPPPRVPDQAALPPIPLHVTRAFHRIALLHENVFRFCHLHSALPPAALPLSHFSLGGEGLGSCALFIVAHVVVMSGCFYGTKVPAAK